MRSRYGSRVGRERVLGWGGVRIAAHMVRGQREIRHKKHTVIEVGGRTRKGCGSCLWGNIRMGRGSPFTLTLLTMLFANGEGVAAQ